MVTFEDIVQKEDELQDLFASLKKRKSIDLNARIIEHIQNIKIILSERITELEQIADNPSKWSAKKDISVPRLQNERRKLVSMLESWTVIGYS